MGYKVISEFIDQDGTHYVAKDAYPTKANVTLNEERLSLLLGGNGCHSFITINDDSRIDGDENSYFDSESEQNNQEDNENLSKDEQELNKEYLESLSNDELKKLLAEDDYTARTNKKELVAKILEKTAITD